MTEVWDVIKKAQKCLWKFSKQRCQVFGMDCFLFWLLRRSFKLLGVLLKAVLSRFSSVLPAATSCPSASDDSAFQPQCCGYNFSPWNDFNPAYEVHRQLWDSCMPEDCEACPYLQNHKKNCMFCSSPLWYHGDLKSLEKEHVHYRCRSILSPEVKSACWNELSSVDAARLVSGLKEKWSLLDKIRKQSIDWIFLFLL